MRPASPATPKAPLVTMDAELAVVPVLVAEAAAELAEEIAEATRLLADDPAAEVLAAGAEVDAPAADVVAPAAEVGAPVAGAVDAPAPPEAVAETAPFTQEASAEFWMVMADEYWTPPVESRI